MAHLRSCVAVRPLRLRGLVLCVSFVLVGVIVGPAVAADQYTVVDLAPAQTVAYYGGPAAINASGTVAGSSGSPMRAFRYGTGLQTLGVLGGGASAESYAYGINTAGWVVGWSATGKNSPGPAHAFRHNGVSMTDLGVIKKGGFSAAYDINDQNLVVGETSVTGATHAFKYDTQLRDLGTLPGYLDSRGYGVNASGKSWAAPMAAPLCVPSCTTERQCATSAPSAASTRRPMTSTTPTSSSGTPERCRDARLPLPGHHDDGHRAHGRLRCCLRRQQRR